MTAFDTDVLTGIFRGDPSLSARFAAVPATDRCVPIIVVEEMLRGRLATIRGAEMGKRKTSLSDAYELLDKTLTRLTALQVLPYSKQADAMVKAWGAQKLKVGPHDLRIAAICVRSGATLATRNQRDFAQVPGLLFQVW